MPDEEKKIIQELVEEYSSNYVYENYVKNLTDLNELQFRCDERKRRKKLFEKVVGHEMEFSIEIA